MHDAIWNEIHVECLLIRYHLWKAKLQEEKSPQTTKVHDVKPIDRGTDNIDQQVQASKEKVLNIGELTMIIEELDHLMDLIINPVLEKPIKSSDGKTFD